MYLHFLKTEEEKFLFMSVAYIVAVAEPSDEWLGAADPYDPGLISLNGKQFAKRFVPNDLELSMLEEYGKELGIDLGKTGSRIEVLAPTQNSLFEHDISDQIFKMLTDNGNWHWRMAQCIKDTITKCNDADTSNLCSRNTILSTALSRIIELYKGTLSQDARRAILFESIAMGLADNNQSENETYVIEELCRFLQLDRELIYEMRDVAVSFSNLYAKGLAIITE